MPRVPKTVMRVPGRLGAAKLFGDNALSRVKAIGLVSESQIVARDHRKTNKNIEEKGSNPGPLHLRGRREVEERWVQIRWKQGG